LRRQLLISALSLLLGAGVAPAAALAQSSTVIRSPAIGGGTTSSNPYGASPYGSAAASSGASSGGGGGQIERLEERINELEDLVRQLTGKVEEANFKAQQANKALERMQGDIDFRFKEMQEGKGGAAPAAAASPPPAPATAANGAPVLIPPKGAVAPGGNGAGSTGLAPGPTNLGQTAAAAPAAPAAAAAPAAPKDPQAAYDAAFAMAQKGDYDNAMAAFDAFLKAYPNHSLAANARYWQGDILFTKKDFGAAAAVLLEAYKKYPKHPKSPDMIFKAAMSFVQRGETQKACSAFAILYKNHPDMPDRISRAASAERQRLGCN
jgi:tol-pal system protein YbgF